MNAFNKYFKGNETRETGDKDQADCESNNVIESSTKLDMRDELLNVKICDNTDKCTSAKEDNKEGNVNHVESKESSDKTSPRPNSTPSTPSITSLSLPTPLPCLTPSPG